MSFILTLLTILWCVVIVKFIFFWLYLWQLKNYHIGRFLDHFRTHQGKKLLFGFLPGLKFVLLLILIANYNTLYFVVGTLLLVYLAEGALFVRSLARKSFKKPVLTSKAIFLTATSFAVTAVFLIFVLNTSLVPFWFVAALLFFDVFLVLFVSCIVLLFQPFFVMARLRILAKATKKMRRFPDVKVIGITGSYGKTSTKEFLTTILSEKFKVLATAEHKNSEIGIAQTILENLNEKYQIFIVEMGAYNKGGIKLLCDMVKPHIGLVTGVNQQHLATFGSLANLLSAEGGQELAQCLGKDDLLVVNGDNKYCLELYKKSGHLAKKVYAMARDKINADIWTEDVIVHKKSVSFIARSGEGELGHFDVAVLGRQQVQNLLGAMLVAKELGMDFGQISKACQNITQEQAGMTLKTGAYGIEVIDASYSSNPDGVAADLDYLSVFQGKKVIVMPCLIELGKQSAQAHLEIGRNIAQVCDMAIITTKDHFEEIKKGALENGMQESQILLLCPGEALAKGGATNQILNTITTFCKADDAVLLEGRVPASLINSLHG